VFSNGRLFRRFVMIRPKGINRIRCEGSEDMSEVQLGVKSERRHDLDALRAFAMLLGIALHAAIPYAPGFPWAIQDSQTNEVFTLLFMIIHGFRMPLFFLISGYFTMMMWRQRGLGALVRQRALRILLPCLLGLVTIVPLSHWLGRLAAGPAAGAAANAAGPAGGKSGEVQTASVAGAVRAGDMSQLRLLLVDAAAANQPDAQFQVRPLAWAAMHGNAEAVQLLLEAGAEIDGGNADGSTALHGAAFTGYPAIVRLLLQRKADPLKANLAGDPPAKSALADAATTGFIWGLLKLPPRDPQETIAGREECLSLLPPVPDSGPVAQPGLLDQVRGVYLNFLTSPRWNIRVLSTDAAMPFHLILTPVFDHLWFLWFLCWMVAGFAVLAPLGQWLGGCCAAAVGLSARLTVGWLQVVWLLPTVLTMCLMGLFGPAFGPDTSLGIVPQPHVLLYYAIFFAFGCLYFAAADSAGQLGRWWWLTLPLSLLVLLPLSFSPVQTRLESALIQSAFAWWMSFGCLGFFRRFLGGGSGWIRWLSDSSYWLYLMHLPLLFAIQAPLRPWSISPFLKFGLSCAVCTGLLLLSYQYLVRYSWVGTLLNGRRTR